jgi:hypothetical protein
MNCHVIIDAYMDDDDVKDDMWMMMWMLTSPLKSGPFIKWPICSSSGFPTRIVNPGLKAHPLVLGLLTGIEWGPLALLAEPEMLTFSFGIPK